jgi:hypothetical protein
MEILYVTNGGSSLSDFHALPDILSFLVVVGGCLGLLTCLWALLVARTRMQRLAFQVQRLELELDQLAPRARPPE